MPVEEKECTMSKYADVNRAGIVVPKTIVKRDGRIVPFDVGRIERAMERCFATLGKTPQTPIPELARRVVNIVSAKANGTSPTVEGVQDIVETVLQAAGEFDAAKHYILYRAEHARRRDERPIPEEVRAAFAESDKFFPTPLQKFQFFDKYSRFNYELGRRETWVETVDRAVGFLYELAGSRLPASTYERIRESILWMKVMPSMRLLAMAGPAARRSHITIYNCSYLPVEGIDAFVEALIISMSGCGVGFSVESRYVENFPRVRRQTGKELPMFVVPDSAEGWAEALRLGLETWFEGGDIRFDFSQVRPAGAPLRTKGGRASGPEPLRVMLSFLRSRILARQGSFIRPIDAHDMMCAVGSAAVSGGVRRTAMISLFDYGDTDMEQSKQGDFERDNSQRWNANNSAVWPEGGLTQTEFIKKFLEMIESGRGEPGIFNRQAAIAMRPSRRQAAEFGTNPSLRRGTLIYTTTGIFPIEQLENRTFYVRNLHGDISPAICFLSGTNKPLYRIVLRGGHCYYATAEHQWPVLCPEGYVKCPTVDLAAGMQLPVVRFQALAYGSEGSYEEGVLAAQLLTHRILFARDNTGRIRGLTATTATTEQFLSTVPADLERWMLQIGFREHALPRSTWSTASEEFRRGLVAGLFWPAGIDHASEVVGNSPMVFAAVSPTLIDEISQLLGFYGIRTSKETNGALHIAEPDDLAHFRAVFGASQQFPSETQHPASPAARQRGVTAIEIVRVEPTDLRETVWDISVFDDTHCFQLAHTITGNCGEVILRPYQFCNLSSAIARADDTFDTLRDKVEVATIIGTIQSLATHFPGLRPIWKKNCEEERLLGVDITGQMDSPIAQDAEVKARLKHIAIETNQRIAAELGINPAAAITCVKPSGNSSQLVDCSSGLHARWSRYYIRNVRVAAYSPLFKVLRDAGVPMDPENGQTPEDANTWVVHFPVKAPEGAITRNDRTAIEQCEYWMQNKLFWTEHNPSVTITYRPDEVIDLMKWVWEHRDKLGGITFLPSFEAQYAQMPYEEIDEERYEQLAAAFPEIDFAKIYRYEEKDLTNLAQEPSCFSGSCEADML